MILNLREYVTVDDLFEHFERFKESYAYDEYMDGTTETFDTELNWFNDNAPYFLPVLDKWVIAHCRI